LTAFGGSEDGRLAALPFFELELLQEGDDGLRVTALLRAGDRYAIRVLSQKLIEPSDQAAVR
jgi:hypothetical protein